jgi:hypothetical protein
MEDECIEFRKIEHRCSELKEWIDRKAPQCHTQQRHLQEGSEERAYWAHGYMSALLDVLRLFSRSSMSPQDSDRDAPRQRYAA